MLDSRQLFLCIFILTVMAFNACKEAKVQVPEKTENELNMQNPETNKSKLRHVVLFKFKDESLTEDINQLNEAFNALPAAIPVIQNFEWGINDSPENFHQDFTHCYLLTFNSESDRDSVYTPHEAHQAFVASLQPHLEKVFVVDYWTRP